MNMPAWLFRGGDDDMDERLEPPPVAMIPTTNFKPLPGPDVDPMQPPPVNLGGSMAGKSDDVEAITKAAALVKNYQEERSRLEQALEEKTRAWKEAIREAQLLSLDLATVRNDLCTAQSQCETLRQECSDLRAFFASMKAQMEHFEIPLPVRKRKKNGETKVKPDVVAPAVVSNIDKVELHTEKPTPFRGGGWSA